MNCPECGTASEAGVRFCAGCGAALRRTCPNCGSGLPEGARFCATCGTPVDVPTDGEGVERKVVSVLFADLAGFTASAAAADPEDVAARLETFHTAVRNDIERYGGRIEKLIGDGVFAIFGAPVAHEDDAERAVRAALRLQETLAALGGEGSIGLAARVAVTTGEAMVRLAGTTRDQEGVVGDTVNMASRLQQLAPEGEVLVDQRTYSATHRLAEYAEHEPVTVKGKDERIDVWVAVRMRSRFGVGVDIEDTAAFVGREDSLRLLVDSFQRAVGGDSAQLVTVTGEPGVGKTRLVSEFRRIVDDRHDLVFWRQGHCLPYGDGISFWALSEIVKAHAGVLDGESNETVRQKILASAEDLMDDQAEASWVTARLLELIGAATGESTRDERFSAWIQFLEALAGRNPLVMVVDDLHWADSALVAFLEELVEAADSVPLLLVVTARPELFDPHPEWGGGKRNSTTIALGPLSAEDTAELVSLLGASPDGGEIADAVLRSGGNPLYATELVRMAADRQASGATDDSIPDTIQAVIASRLDLLDPKDKALLQAASVVGKVFWSGAVADALGRAEVDGGLRRLARRELIRRARRSSIRDQDEYSFWHDLVADVAYGQIPRRTRRDTHRAVAAWLEETAGERTGEVAEILAHHYGTALDLTRALGGDDVELATMTRLHLLEAAARAENVAFDRAAGLLRRALELSPSPVAEAEVLIRLAKVESMSAGGERAIEYSRRALDRALESGDAEIAALAASRLSRAYWDSGDGENSYVATRQALELSSALADGPTLTRVLSASIGTLFLRGEFAGIEELIARTLAVGEAHGPRTEYLNALKWAGTHRAEQGDPEGVVLLRRAYQEAMELGDTSLIITTANNLASFLINPEGIDICRATIALGTSRGAVNSGDFTRLTLCEALWHLGRWSEIPPESERLIRTYGSSTYAGQGGIGWRAILGVSRRNPDSYDWAVECLTEARRVQDHQMFVPALATMIEAHHQRGEDQAALVLLREFEKLTEDRLGFRTEWLRPIARMLADLGEIDWLQQLVDPLEPDSHLHETNFYHGLLRRAQGDPSGAIAQLDTAVVIGRDTGSPWKEGDALVERAAAHIDLGALDAARRDLDDAEGLFALMGGSIFDDYLDAQRARVQGRA